MRAHWRLSLTLSALAVVVSACSSGSGGAAATTTVTTTVTSTGSAPTMSPPHVVVTPSQGTATTSATGAASIVRCDGPTLAVSVGAGEGAAGTIHYPVVFTNRGRGSCYLQGFPGVSAADAGGAAKVDAARDTTTAATRVVLTAAGSAHADLAVRNVPPGSGACPSYPLLLVTPPDSRRTSTVSRTVRPCAAQMRVTVVRPGAS